MNEEWRNEIITKGAAVDAIMERDQYAEPMECIEAIKGLSPAQPEIVRCKDCKHNPKETWFECPMSHLSEKQRPETAWCWKGERRTDA